MSLTLAIFHLRLQDVDVLFMQSDGGLTPMEQFCGSRAVLSGPAGGVVGYAITSYSQMEKKPVIGFDMGGEWRFSAVMNHIKLSSRLLSRNYFRTSMNDNNDEGKMPQSALRLLDMKLLLPHQELLLM